MNDKIIDAQRINHAVKWSSITEITVKAIQPITNMILARLLVPEVFGVVASVVLVTSLADMLSDSGFQKYLIQHEFSTQRELFEYATVAFWVNICFSLLLWGLIALFSGTVAELVGCSGLGRVVVIACAQLPMTAFSSIQIALFRRAYDFRAMYPIRLAVAVVPLVIAVPAALLGWGYWALIAGNIAGQALNAILLTVKSKWKPSFYFSMQKLKIMLSFTVWTLLEAISIWLTSNCGILICGRMLGSNNLGLFKTANGMVNSFFGVFSASIITVLYTALSRAQNDEIAFKGILLRFQRLLGFLVLPAGAGIFLYSPLATQVLLGSQWSAAAPIIGLESLALSITIVSSHLCSEIYRAKGYPRISMAVQLAYTALLIPALVLSARSGFQAFYYTYCTMSVVFISLQIGVTACKFKIMPLEMLRNLLPHICGTVVMAGVGYILQQTGTTVLWQTVSIAICALFYFTTVMLFPAARKEMRLYGERIFHKA